MNRYLRVLMFLVFIGLFLNMSSIGLAAGAKTPNRGSLENGKVVSGVLTSDKDSHIYSISVQQNGTVYVSLEKIKGRVTVSLSDANGNTKSTADSYSSSFTTLSADVSAGLYFLSVMPYGWGNGTSIGTYDIKATYGAGEVSYDASFEPNDTFNNAFPLKSGQAINNELKTATDIDVFKITTDNNGEIYVRFDNVKGRFSANLYDEAGNSKASTDSYSSSTTTLSATVAKGNYYLKVIPYGWSDTITSGTQTIKATFASGTPTFGMDYESNDIAYNAYEIKIGSTYQSKLSSVTDVDWYKFTTEKDGDIYTVLTDVKGRTTMNLYDQEGNSKGSADSYSSTWTSFGATLKKGTYYIKVTPYGWGDSTTSGSYILKSTFAVEKVVRVDDYEYNDTFENAYRIKSGTNYDSNLPHPSDIDWYKIKTNEDGTVKVNFSNVKGRISANLYDENKNSKSSTDSYSTDNATFSIELKKGTYYLRVTPYGWGDARTDGSYSMNSTFPMDESISILLNDKNLSFEQSPTILNGSTFVPLRAIFEALNSQITWDNDTRTVIASKGSTKMVLQIGASSAIIDGKSVNLENPARIIGGSTMVPVRFVSESLNAKVEWDSENSTVIIKTN